MGVEPPANRNTTNHPQPLEVRVMGISLETLTRPEAFGGLWLGVVLRTPSRVVSGATKKLGPGREEQPDCEQDGRRTQGLPRRTRLPTPDPLSSTEREREKLHFYALTFLPSPLSLLRVLPSSVGPPSRPQGAVEIDTLTPNQRNGETRNTRPDILS